MYLTSNDGLTQYKYVTNTQTKWTKRVRVKGLPKEGEELFKGNQLFYYKTGGSTTSLAISFGFGYGPVSVGVSMGSASTSKKGVYGVAKTAKKHGYYILNCKQKVQVKGARVYGRVKQSDNSWGKWSFCTKTGRVVKVVKRSVRLKSI